MTGLKWIWAVALGLLAVQAGAEEASVLKTSKEQASYAIGVQVAKNFKRDEIDVDLDLMLKGMKDGLSGERLLMPEKELRKVMRTVQAEIRKKMVLNRRMAAVENQKKSAAFLAQNKARDGVVALPSGLQYRVLKVGEGKRPADGDAVVCNYRGTLLDGTEFDGTEPGMPATFKLAQVIPGWREALKLMPSGSRWQIFIPPQLAYGERGAGNDIGPNETLVFEMELVAVK